MVTFIIFYYKCYESVSFFCFLQKISSDTNAEKLCSRYEPHVCLTRDALVRLLDNHGPDFQEQWELPVCVKLNAVKGTASSFMHSDCRHGR